ncbi:MAG: hypothetical protein ACKVPX_09290 [Myxococcaceae bacterium]
MAKASADHPALASALTHYDAGDVVSARRAAIAVLQAVPQNDATGPLADAARALVARTLTPRWAFVPGLAVMVLWLLLVLLAWARY